MCARFRARLRLRPAIARVQFTPASKHPDAKKSPQHVSTAIHRFEEIIGGHPYLIEVVAVAKDRWRAYIVRIPGVPTALMPFYGPTPDEAASLLRQWLTRAHERASAGTRSAR
jgi:hypothetical protein